MNASGGGRPVRGPRSRDVTSQTRTPAAPGADGTALLFTLWALSMIITGIVFVLRYLFRPSPPTPLPLNGAPPNPGGFDSRKYPTRELKEAWIKAYTARVEWERAHPKKIILPLPDQTIQKWSIDLKLRQQA